MAGVSGWGLDTSGPFAGSDSWGGGMLPGVSSLDWINAGSKVLSSALSPSSAPSYAAATSVLHAPFDSSGWIVGTSGSNLSGNTTRGGGQATGATPISLMGEQPGLFSGSSSGIVLPLLLVVGGAWAAAKLL